MLAERRERRKWSVNPNGTTWSQDTNKFGTKMLEKMGWTEGKGLGANEDGRTQHIRVKKKNDYRGLGCSVKEAHKWVAHQDDFTSLLAQLNGHHSENAQAEKEVVSLEKHSKSQKRVHYHKFTRGKDLSNYGQNDLDAIFGRKKKASKSAPVTPIELSEESSSGEESAASCPEEVSSKKSKKRKHGDGGGNQITSTLSVQEYFAQRMAKLKNKSTADNSTEQTVNDKDATGDKKVVEKKTSCLNGDTTNSEQMESKGGQSLNNYITSNISVQEYFKQRMATAKGKSSLSKPTEETKTNDGDSVSNEKVAVVERNNEILPSDEKVLKKKKKKKFKKITDEQNSVNLRNDEQSHKKDKPKKSTLNHDNELKSGVTTPQKKKSKKRKVIDDSGNGDQSDVSTEKKKCKKRKKDRTCIDDNNSSKAKRSE